MNRGEEGAVVAGFSLVEVLVALGLLALTLAGATALQMQALRASEEAGRAARASALARDFLARSAMVPWSADPSSPTVPPAAAQDSSVNAPCRAATPCSPRRFASTVISGWSLALRGAGGSAPAPLPDADYCTSTAVGALAVTLVWPSLQQAPAAQGPSPCGVSGEAWQGLTLRGYAEAAP